MHGPIYAKHKSILTGAIFFFLVPLKEDEAAEPAGLKERLLFLLGLLAAIVNENRARVCFFLHVRGNYGASL